MLSRVRSRTAPLLAVVLLGGCGDETGAPRDTRSDDFSYTVERAAPEPGGDETAVVPPAHPDPAELADPASPVASSGLAFDGPFTIEDGVWFLGSDFPSTDTMTGKHNGLLASARGGVWVSGPALYGVYEVAIEDAEVEPPVPSWCADVVEAPYRHAGGPFTLGSFETFDEVGALEQGTYRVRLCAEGLDRVAAETAEDEFDDAGNYVTYSGRFLFQVWPSAERPDAVLRVGSQFARDAHRDATGG